MNFKKSLLIFVTALSAAFTALLSQAVEMSLDNYDIYVGDLNNDGKDDFYFKGKDKYIILHGDIATPIRYLTVPNFVIYRSGDGYAPAQLFSLSASDLDARVLQGALRLEVLSGSSLGAGTDALYWRDDAIGVTSVLLRGADSYQPALLLFTSNSADLPVIAATYDISVGQVNFSDRGYTFALQDVNADGRRDLVYSGQAYLANYNGIISGVGHSINSLGKQVELPFTTVSRFNLAGQLTGTISPDPDGVGVLHYQAMRNTYSATTGLLIATETGELTNWYDENTPPASWAGFTVFSSKVYNYDAQGRKITERVYDKNGSLIALTQASYDPYDRVLCVAQRMNFAVDPALYPDACYLTPEQGTFGPDRITRYSYDNSYGLVLTEERALRTNLQQTYVTNTYSGALLTSQTDANNNKTALYYYSDTKRLKRVVYPSTTKGANSANGSETGTTGDYVEFQYDNNGNKTYERKRSGAVINYAYDNNNRLIEKDLADNTKDVCYDYDLDGLQTAVRFGSNTLSCTGNGITSTYDGFGHLSSSQNTTLGTNFTINYAYDSNGNRIGIKHPDGIKFGYTFDAVNRVKTLGEATNAGASDYAITNTALTVNYQANGMRGSLARGGSTTTYNFLDGVRLSSFVQSFPANTDKSLTNSFTYTPLGQIYTLSQSNANYFYTGSDNRTGAYVADGLNRYSTVAGQPLGYDGNSNLTNDGTRIYTYDDENRLLSVSGSGLSASLYYDPNGRLFQTAINGTVRRFVFDGDALIAEYNGSNQLQRRYLHGDQVDEPLVQYNGTSVAATNRTYLHVDHQGSIIAQSNNAGSVTATLAYDAYGIPAAKNANVSGAFGYTGQIYLPELGLDYYKARMYHPKLGRFLQTDPIGYKDQMNLYAYVGNDPVNRVDPTGKFLVLAIPLLPEIGAALSAAASYVAGAFATATTTELVVAGVGGTALATGAVIVKNESSENTKENKGQTKPEVGDCPSCGGETSNKPGKIASEHGLKPAEVKDKIHELKGGAKLPNNPDVEVCNDCGEVFPQTEDGGLGDSIGNIDEDY